MRINKPLVRFAAKHPVLYSVASGVVIAPWITFLFRSILIGVLAGLATFALQLTLWLPGGAMRTYCDRRLDP